MSLYSVNKVILLGNVTRDPMVRATSSGKSVASFSLATNESIKKGDSYEDAPTFHNIVAWEKTAEYLAKNVGKGTKLYVEGRIQNRTWEKDDGSKAYATEIVAQKIIAMSDTRKAENDQVSEPIASEDLADDIDF